MNRCLVLLACLCMPACGTSAAPPRSAPDSPPLASAPAASSHFQPLPEARSLLETRGLRGTFVVRRSGDPSLYATDPDLAPIRYLPASTFKIPHALLALETGVADSERFTLPWDGTPGYFASWNRDHDLRSAMEHSVVWYFQELARRIGHARMNALVQGLGYGNAQIGEQVDLFWLEGPLAISAEEQVRFVERLLADDLPVAPRHAATVRQIIPVRQVGQDTIHAKTGTAIRQEEGHGWLVGWTERGGATTSCFAMLLLVEEAAERKRVVEQRWEVATELLQAAGVIGS